jgi:diguanylate cyclase (GGDEF)-like protein
MGQPARDLGRMAGVALATGIVYRLLAEAMWEIDPTWGSAFWPAAGITFAVLVRSPLRWWPAIVLSIGVAELVANLDHGTSGWTAGWGAVANMAEPVLGASLFLRFARQRRFGDLHTLGWFVVAGVLAGPALGAMFGGVIAGTGPDSTFELWVRWFVGDGVGVVAVAPALLVTSTGFLRAHLPEAAVLGVVLLGACALIAGAVGSLVPVGPYLVVPVLVWAALRFGLLGAAITSTVTALVVHAATATGHGPFITSGEDRLVVAQTYIGVMALTMLTVATLVASLAAGRRNEHALLQRALHDTLTGLPNRAMLEMRLADGDLGGVLSVDLDGFKDVNDTYGHAVGDAVLCTVAARLLAACRPDDLVTRVGGDEFVVVLRGTVSDEVLAETAARLERKLAEPIVHDGLVLQIGASVGAVPSSFHESPSELLLEADRLMYQGKERRGRLRPGLRITR